MGLLRVLLLVFASILVDAAGPVVVSAAPEVEELQEEEARRHRRLHALRAHRMMAKLPVPGKVTVVSHRPPPRPRALHRPALSHRILKTPTLVVDSPSAPEDH